MTKCEYWLMKCQKALEKAARVKQVDTAGWYIAAECFAVAYQRAIIRWRMIDNGRTEMR